ncbi:hypothetical protein Pcinc_008968 [Petrolisthes cinctipes]|uniref:DUF7153 domain-containing protein n=1 Tax=Petrolisthes cinctipes TaxID=88211 RepID=A0AAE1KYY9_PETCI|nr:hypothetical protein Pcinc_008968 [Petrolisthes cinctipes]
MVTARRCSSLAPTLWTPAVRRSPPGPRPANFDEQEEPGRKRYFISFVTRSNTSRPRSSLLRPRHQHQQQHQQQQPQQHHHQQHRHHPPSGLAMSSSHWQASGKQYINWIGNLVANPMLMEGHLLKGLEIGVQYPALYLKEGLREGDSSGGHQESKGGLPDGCLGPECRVIQGVYEELVSWMPELLVPCPSDPSLWARCYILLGFMTLEGELNKLASSTEPFLLPGVRGAGYRHQEELLAAARLCLPHEAEEHEWLHLCLPESLPRHGSKHYTRRVAHRVFQSTESAGLSQQTTES